MKSRPVASKSKQKMISHLRELSYLLDESINIPGTNYRFGIDPLLGLLPGAGDYLGAIFSTYIIFQSARLGVSKATLSRMAVNIITETFVGTIPLLGDIFDANWKANKRNIELLNIELNNPKTMKKANLWFLLLLLTIVLLVLIAATLITFWLLKFIWTVLFAS